VNETAVAGIADLAGHIYRDLLVSARGIFEEAGHRISIKEGQARLIAGRRQCVQQSADSEL